MTRLPFNPWRGLGGLPADVWIVFATTLTNRIGTMALPLLAVYLAEHLGYPTEVAGLAITVYGVGSLASASVAGRLSDRHGGLRVMRAALLLSGGLLLIVPLVSSVAAVFSVIFVWACAAEAIRPASLATLTGVTRADQRKAAVALNRLAINLGMSVGPAVGGLLAAISFPLLFVVDGVTSILAGGVLTALIGRRGSGAVPADRPAEASRRAVVTDRRLVAFLVATFGYYAVFLQVDAALPLFLVRDLGLPISFFGLTFVVNTILIILFEVPLNLSTTRWGHRWPLASGAALTAIGFGGLAVADSRAAVIGLVVIWTMGEMIFLPGAAAYVADLAPPAQRGAYVGAYATTFSVALITAPWLGSVVLDRFGPQLLWPTLLGIGLGASLLVLRVVQDERPARGDG